MEDRGGTEHGKCIYDTRIDFLIHDLDRGFDTCVHFHIHEFLTGKPR